jgi:UDP-glucose 4-epimerase
LIAEAGRLGDVLGWQPIHSSLTQIISSAWEWMTMRGLVGGAHDKRG